MATTEDDDRRPRFAQPAIAAVWGDLPEEAKATLFQLLNGPDRRQALDTDKADFESATRQEQVTKGAADTLLYWDITREAKRLDRERQGAADSWKRQQIADLFDEEQQEPEVGAFDLDDTSNGGHLFYAGKVNEIHGPSESGKSMVLLAVAAQEMRAGRNVAMVDYEDDGKSIVNRLRWVFGLTRDLIERHFYYFNPETPLGDEGLDELKGASDASLFIIDAVTEAMSVEGLDGRNENEVATWYNLLPKKIASWGPAVVVVDHVGKGDSTAQIGSQHKKSGITGVSYTAEPVFPFTRGGRGKLLLKVAKDRPGGVRAAALPQGEGRQHWRGEFTIDGTVTPASPQVSLRGVDPALTGQAPRPVTPEEPEEPKQDFEPLTDRQLIYLKALSAAGVRGRNMSEMYADEEIPKAERPHRTTPRRVIVEQLEPRGYTEQVPQDKGRWRVTPRGAAKILQHEKDAQDRLKKWSESPSRRTGSRGGSEPVGEPVDEPV